MFEDAVYAAQSRVRLAANLPLEYKKVEVEFWRHVETCCRKAESDARRAKCRTARKTTYSSEAVARVAAQYGAEKDVGAQVWNAYPCADCRGWHVGHGWKTRTTDAMPLALGRAYAERVEVACSAAADGPLDIHRYREQMQAALCELGDHSFDVEGDYTFKRLWPRALRVRVAPATARRMAETTSLRVGTVQVSLSRHEERPLRAQPKLFARLVTVKNAMTPEDLGRSLARRVASWGGSAAIAVGDRKVVQVVEHAFVGFEVEMSDMDSRTSMIVQSEGLGGRIRYGCGFFF